MSQNLRNKGIVLFDGYCNLCSGSVKFIIKRDKRDYFRFSSLQSEFGKQYISKYGIPSELSNSVILIENNKVYYKSTAALRIVKKLKGLWFLLYIFIIVPNSIRDFIYMIISNNRYKWFGKKKECFIPIKDFNFKFLK